MGRGKPHFTSEFVPEWCAVATLALLDDVWAAHIRLAFTVTHNDFLILALALSVMVALRLFAVRRGGLMAEYFALTLAASTAICALSYLCLASAGPLADSRLMAMDRAMGFDWLAGYRFVHAHPALAATLGLAYGSLVYQGLYFCVLHGLMAEKRRLRDMFWLFLASGALACLGTLLLPALGPSKFYNIETASGFVPVMQHLLSGKNLSFALSGMTGVVSFPSFHTTMALAYAWAFRRTGVIGMSVMTLNLVMLCAVPFFGGHYLVDMIAGAAAMLLALALVKTAPILWKKFSAASASPESAGAYGDAY
jgi:hypothetical protein